MIGRIMITKSGHGGVELVKKYCWNFCVLLYRQCDKVLFLRESNLMKRGFTHTRNKFILQKTHHSKKCERRCSSVFYIMKFCSWNKCKIKDFVIRKDRYIFFCIQLFLKGYIRLLSLWKVQFSRHNTKVFCHFYFIFIFFLFRISSLCNKANNKFKMFDIYIYIYIYIYSFCNKCNNMERSNFLAEITFKIVNFVLRFTLGIFKAVSSILSFWSAYIYFLTWRGLHLKI